MSDREQLPPPLVPSEVDLTDFRQMALDVRMVRDSKFAVETDPEAFRAGVLLWCAAWHQIPAGSLPDNDKELATLAGFGRVVEEWLKFRDEALWKFIKCSDGRLYHPVIAEKAMAAWTSRLRHHYDRMCDRLRKANKQRADQTPPLPAIAIPAFDDWNAARLAAGHTQEFAAQSYGIPATGGGIPPENGLKGKGREKGKGKGRGKGKGTSRNTGAAAPPAVADAPAAPQGQPLLPLEPEPPAPPPSTPPPPAPPPEDDGKPMRERDLVALGVEAKHARDWLHVRKEKRAPLTRTAWEGVVREAQAAGIEPAKAVQIAAENSWQGFRAAWLAREGTRLPPGLSRQTFQSQREQQKAARYAEMSPLLAGGAAALGFGPPPDDPNTIDMEDRDGKTAAAPRLGQNEHS